MFKDLHRGDDFEMLKQACNPQSAQCNTLYDNDHLIVKISRTERFNVNKKNKGSLVKVCFFSRRDNKDFSGSAALISEGVFVQSLRGPYCGCPRSNIKSYAVYIQTTRFSLLRLLQCGGEVDNTSPVAVGGIQNVVNFTTAASGLAWVRSLHISHSF